MEILSTKILDYDKSQEAYIVEVVTFNNGHKVKYVKADLYSYDKNPGEIVHLFLWNGVIPMFVKNMVDDWKLSSIELADYHQHTIVQNKKIVCQAFGIQSPEQMFNLYKIEQTQVMFNLLSKISKDNELTKETLDEINSVLLSIQTK